MLRVLVWRGRKMRHRKRETNGRSAQGHVLAPHRPKRNASAPRGELKKPEPERKVDARNSSVSTLRGSVRARKEHGFSRTQARRARGLGAEHGEVEFA
jgi:hypothetical protein